METKLVIAAGAFYLDSDGRVRGPMLEGSSDQGPFFSENANGFPGWDSKGIPLQGSQWKDGPRLVEECFVVKHPQDDMPIIPLDILRALAHKGGPIPHLFPATKLHFMKVSDMPKWDADHPRVWSERWQRWMPAWKDRLMNSREETGPRPKVRAEVQRMRIVLKNLGVNNVKDIGNGIVEAMFKNYSDGILKSTYWNELEQSFNDVLTDNPKGFEFARHWMPVKYMFAEDRLDLYPRPEVNAFYRHRNGNLYEVTGFNNEEHARQDEYPTKVEYRNYMTGKKYSRDLVDWWRSMTETPVYALKPHEKRIHNRRTRYLGNTPEFGVSLESEKLDRGPNWHEVKITFVADDKNMRVVSVLAEPFGDIPAGTVMERNENGTVQPAKTEPPKATIVLPKARLSFPNLVDPKQERPKETKFKASVTLDTRDPASRSFMEDVRKTTVQEAFRARETKLAERASKEIAERILKGLLVTGFENDRDIEKVLDDQRPLVENSIKRMLLEGIGRRSMHRTIEELLAEQEKMRGLLKEQRELIAHAEKTASLIMEQINDVKRKLYAKGWKDNG